ncbi:hypothetical protein Q3G72_027157 [Acer saccharum]|nr:hypothetical protein Q3G72_027157 [Acer saccharum]
MMTPWKNLLLLFIIFLYSANLLTAQSDDHHDYPSAQLSTSWKNNNFSAINITKPSKSSQLIMRIILLNLPSGSGIGFAFGFLSNLSSGSSFLAAASVRIRINFLTEYVHRSDVEVFWLANRNKPVHENATLLLHTNGDLILRDVDGSLVWSTNTSNLSVVGLQMLKTGNLVLQDGKNRTIWQSFDHPTDTLLPGQKLMAGQKLVARASANDWNEGRFYLSVTSEGLFAFYKSNVPRMYLNFTVYGIKESEQPSYIRSVNGTLALYMLSAEPSEPDVVLSRPVDNTAIGYMRFDSDGHFRFYNDSMEPVDLLADVLQECDYPSICGDYGLCSNGQCSCPAGFAHELVSDDRSESRCTEINPPTCENRISPSLLQLQDVHYFNYVDPDAADLKGIPMESCKQACLRNCTCKAALFRFYYNITHGNCFLPSQVLSLINERRERNVYRSYAFIKISDDRELERGLPTKTRVIIGVIVGTFLVVILIAGFYILRLRKKRDTEGGIEDYLEHFSEMPMRFSYEELKLATQDFKKKLGEGGFGSVFEVMEVVCGRKNLDRSQSSEYMHFLPLFVKKVEEERLIDVVDKYSEDMQLHWSEVMQMMRVAVWCLQNDFNKRPSMSTVVKVLEGTIDFEASLTDVTVTTITGVTEEQFGASRATTSELSPSILSGPR